MKNLIAALFVVSFLGACSSKAIKEESKVAPPPVATVQAPQAAEPAPAQSASMSEKKTVVNPLTDPNNVDLHGILTRDVH